MPWGAFPHMVYCRLSRRDRCAIRRIRRTEISNAVNGSPSSGDSSPRGSPSNQHRRLFRLWFCGCLPGDVGETCTQSSRNGTLTSGKKLNLISFCALCFSTALESLRVYLCFILPEFTAKAFQSTNVPVYLYILTHIAADLVHHEKLS